MVADDAGAVEGSTRERLLEAGMRLFAEKGFRATTVGELEAAVGLQPRRGALYKHFASKQALLEAGVQRHLDAVDAAVRLIDLVPFTDVHTEATVLGRWLLGQLDDERPMTRILENDGDRLPVLRARLRERISDAGYRATGELIRRWAGPSVDHLGIDVDAMAVVLLGPLINARRSAWTFAAPPLGVDDDRLLAAWVDLCVRFIASVAAEG